MAGGFRNEGRKVLALSADSSEFCQSSANGIFNMKGPSIKRELPAVIMLDSSNFENGTFPGNTNDSNSRLLLDNSHFEGESLVGATANSKTNPLETVENSSVLVGNPQNNVSSSNASHGPVSLPASENWVGECGFTVSFGPQEKNTKGVSWTYSKAKDKLYVGKDCPCPINFSTKKTMPDDVTIRAIAVYSSPEHASEAVQRCINHSVEELHRGIVEAEHLVRCESVMATYEVDSTSKRHSVIVPYENQPAGQSFSTYIYKFTCFGSCAGGPNRRPLRLVFTLERRGEVLGRRRIDVKICACPGRDRRSEEQQIMGPGLQLPMKRPNEVETVSLAESFNFTKSVKIPQEKKYKPNHHNGKYTIEVDSKEGYEFMMQMKRLFYMCRKMSNLPDNVVKALFPHKLTKPNVEEPDSSS